MLFAMMLASGLLASGAPATAADPPRPDGGLVDAAIAASLATLEAAGFVGPTGAPAIDGERLLPQVEPTESGKRTYRICSESETEAATCTRTLRLPQPVRVDVTGDGTDDVSAYLRPAQAGGLTLLVRRLSSSETAGAALPAHVWAEHDLSDSTRLSLGFDGFRRGSTLPQETVGTFTVDRARAEEGVFDVGGAVTQTGAGGTLAVTTGLAALAAGGPTDPTVASAQFSPVPSAFETHAIVDLAANQDTVDATTNEPTTLDVIVIANRQPGGTPFTKFHQFQVGLVATAAETLSRPSAGAASLVYEASDPTGEVAVTDSEYVGGVLDRSTLAVGQTVPATFTAKHNGTGDAVRLEYAASAAMAELDTKVFDRAGHTASELALSDLPTSLDLRLSGPSDGVPLAVPALSYTGNSGTLDGQLQVQAAAAPGPDDLALTFTNLGNATATSTAPDGSVRFLSTPRTDALRLSASLDTSVPNRSLDLEVFDQNGFTGRLVGHVGAPTIHLGDVTLALTGLRSMRLLPGAESYLSMGIDGDYNHLGIDVDDVYVDPDVELTLEVDGPTLLDYDIPFVIQDPFTEVRFHVADQVLREAGCAAVDVFGVGTSHVRIFTKPGPIAGQINHVDVFGANGPQALNYLDGVPSPPGQDPNLTAMGVSLLTVYVSQPLPNPDAQYDVDFGGC